MVNKYSPGIVSDNPVKSGMIKDNNGSYVKFEDYANVLSHAIEMKSALTDLIGHFRSEDLYRAAMYDAICHINIVEIDDCSVCKRKIRALRLIEGMKKYE